ncbi:MAG: alpha/beta hydrolase [Bosea sp. (in: a-proteobacteria)]
MTTADLSHIHRYERSPLPNAPVLLMLHGTGADEHDLVPLAREIAPHAHILSPRGPVKEGAANRWFRRMAEGVFDEEDLALRADALAHFIVAAHHAYKLPSAPIAIGFSNGANIAAGLLWRHPGTLNGAVLMRAMRPFAEAAPLPMPGKPVLLLSGRRDPFAPEAARNALADGLEAAGAALDHRITGDSHGLVSADITAAQGWLPHALSGKTLPAVPQA